MIPVLFFLILSYLVSLSICKLLPCITPSQNVFKKKFLDSVKSVYRTSVHYHRRKKLIEHLTFTNRDITATTTSTTSTTTLKPTIMTTIEKNKKNSTCSSFTNVIRMKTIGLSHEFDSIPYFRGGGNQKKKVLILISDTGGGHRASAQAIDHALSALHKDQIDVSIVDIWTDYAKWPFNRFVPTYRFLARHPILWRGFYAYGGFPPTKVFTEICSKISSYSSFKNAIIQRNPDIVLSMHPLCQLMPLSIVGEINKKRNPESKKVPFVTIVTDLGGAHSTWFDKRADWLFVPSEEVKKIALRNGIKNEKIIMRGLPIRPAFWQAPKPKRQLRNKLGLSLNSKIVLIMGGGDGVGGLNEVTSEIARKFENLDTSSELVVICGHNTKTANLLQSRKWPKNVKVQIKGFVDNIDEFMGASDCLVTKAGPGTIAEAMTKGLPVVLSSFLPGQEAGNVPYVVNGKFGVYSGLHPGKIAQNVFDLCTNQAKLDLMSKNSLRLSHPKATLEIAEDISNILFHPERPKSL